MSRFTVKHYSFYFEIFEDCICTYNVWHEYTTPYMFSYLDNEKVLLKDIGCGRDMSAEEIYERCIAYICLTGH